MTIDPLALAPEADAATARLMETLDRTPADALAAPSLLPGWSRGHVLSHLARNADALRNLLTWARTGVETPAYPSAAARAAGIEEGARRPLDVQIEDVRAASQAFADDAAAMPAPAWSAILDDMGPAAAVVWRRLREIEVHHVDLDLGYAPADWPPAFAQRLLHEAATFRPRSTGDLPGVVIQADEMSHALTLGGATSGGREATVTVSGPACELAAWLCGRPPGASLTVTPAGPLPALPDWM